MLSLNQDYLPQRESESRHVREYAAHKLDQLSKVTDKSAFMQKLNDITNEVIGVSRLDKAENRKGTTQHQQLAPEVSCYVDKDLLKTPSGQMLLKLKELRRSINNGISGAPIAENVNQTQISFPAAHPSTATTDRVGTKRDQEQAPHAIPQVVAFKPKEIDSEYMSGSRRVTDHPVVDDEDLSQSSAGEEDDAASLSDSVASSRQGSFSIGNLLLRFQRYFFRQVPKQSHLQSSSHRCRIEVLIADLMRDVELRKHVNEDKLQLVRKSLHRFQDFHNRESLSIAEFINVVVSANADTNDRENGSAAANLPRGASKHAVLMSEESSRQNNTDNRYPSDTEQERRINRAPSPTNGHWNGSESPDVLHASRDNRAEQAPPHIPPREPKVEKINFTEEAVNRSRGSIPDLISASLRLSPAIDLQVNKNQEPITQLADQPFATVDAPNSNSTQWHSGSGPSAGPPMTNYVVQDISKKSPTTVALPVPTTGVPAFGLTDVDISEPPVIKSKKLPLPELFYSASNYVDLSNNRVKGAMGARSLSGNKQIPLYEHMSVGDSIDLSGLSSKGFSDLIH